MHGIIYRHIGRTGLGWIDGQKSPVFRRGKSGNPTISRQKFEKFYGEGLATLRNAKFTDVTRAVNSRPTKEKIQYRTKQYKSNAIHKTSCTKS